MQYDPPNVDDNTIIPRVLGFNVIMMDPSNKEQYSVHLQGSENRSYIFNQTAIIEAAGLMSDSRIVIVQVETLIGTFSSTPTTFSGVLS